MSGTSDLPLFADARPPAPFQSSSKTSRVAGVTRTRAAVASKRERVLLVITAAGEKGATCSAISEQLGIPDHWITSSIARLFELGSIADSGLERENPRSGKAQRVLVAQRAR
ncbi:MAG: hypothetical protein WEA80_01750 [Gemmatimonadaceae bacterium]